MIPWLYNETLGVPPIALSNDNGDIVIALLYIEQFAHFV